MTDPDSRTVPSPGGGSGQSPEPSSSSASAAPTGGGSSAAGRPTKLGKLLGAMGLGKRGPELLLESIRPQLEGRTDDELAEMTLRVTRLLGPELTRRIAFHALAATALELEGIKPQGLVAYAATPERWRQLVPPTPRR